MRSIFSTTEDISPTIARVALGIVYFAHGAQKMLGWFGGYGFSATMGFFTSQHIPAWLAFIVICTEFFGSIALLLGLLGRLSAFLIAFEMLVAVALVHSHFGFFMNWTGQQKGEGFEFHILALALLLIVIIKGSGAASVDLAVTEGSGAPQPAAA
jgi:putative oxidoreductase